LGETVADRDQFRIGGEETHFRVVLNVFLPGLKS
jgi:hypothetical protein